jgi:hypothetical protein
MKTRLPWLEREIAHIPLYCVVPSDPMTLRESKLLESAMLEFSRFDPINMANPCH